LIQEFPVPHLNKGGKMAIPAGAKYVRCDEFDPPLYGYVCDDHRFYVDGCTRSRMMEEYNDAAHWDIQWDEPDPVMYGSLYLIPSEYWDRMCYEEEVLDTRFML
jgi:hypothetical protein